MKCATNEHAVSIERIYATTDVRAVRNEVAVDERRAGGDQKRSASDSLELSLAPVTVQVDPSTLTSDDGKPFDQGVTTFIARTSDAAAKLTPVDNRLACAARGANADRLTSKVDDIRSVARIQTGENTDLIAVAGRIDRCLDRREITASVVVDSEYCSVEFAGRNDAEKDACAER